MKALSLHAFLTALLSPQCKILIKPFSAAIRTIRNSTPSLKPRILEYHDLVFTLSKEASFKFGARKFSIKPGSLMMIAPGVPHECLYPLGMSLCHLRFNLQIGGKLVRTKSDYLLFPSAWPLSHAIRSMISEIQSPSGYHTLRIRSLLGHLITDLTFANHTERLEQRTFIDGQRKRIEEYVSSHLLHPVSSRDLAHLLHLSHEYFMKLFKNTYRVPVRKYLVRLRVQEAVRLLLESHQTISQVAQSVGYSDIYLFSRLFKNEMGMPPREFRKRRT